ncbi:hypothetical protein [Elioraea rosea]|uniref:hypothetical protein n=1 Tax=Elioraea rosea TaxID=2492390 RepID=UPI0011822313|nr:hypothetical protein [Elioraea rosea]
MRAAAFAPAPPEAAPMQAAWSWTLGAANDAAEAEADRIAARVLAGLPASPSRKQPAGVLRREGEGGGRSVDLPSAGDLEAEAAALLAEALVIIAAGQAIAEDMAMRVATAVADALLTLGRAAIDTVTGAALAFGAWVVEQAANLVVYDAGFLFALIRTVEAVAARVAALPEDIATLAREARRLAEAGAATVQDWADAFADAAGVREAPAESHRSVADREADAERAAEAAGVHPPIGSVCGPDVTAQTASVWARVQADFAGWSDTQKCASCTSLVNPIIQGSDPPSQQMVETGLQALWETGNVVVGGQGVLLGLGLNLNRDAFDTLGLYLGSASYLRAPPYSPPCGQPGSPNPSAEANDRVHETPSTCATTVQIGPECWVSGTANYGTYGIMMHACYDWLAAGGACWLPSSLFSRTATIVLVQAYKRLDRDDPEPPTRWALATYDGGASAYASGGNRPNCPTSCPMPYSGAPFSYVWEPVVPRAGP